MSLRRWARATIWRYPTAALVLVAAIAVLADGALSRVIGPPATTLTVYNTTTAAVSFTTGGVNPATTWVSACSTAAFQIVQHEWRRVDEAVPMTSSPADTVVVDVAHLVPSDVGAFGSRRWQMVISAVGMSANALYPRLPSPPPCSGRPRERLDLSGSGTATLGPYRLAGRYRISLTVAVPDAKGCVFAATARSTDAQGADRELVDEMVLYEYLRSTGSGYGGPDLRPGEYEIEVTSACGAWAIELIPS